MLVDEVTKVEMVHLEMPHTNQVLTLYLEETVINWRQRLETYHPFTEMFKTHQTESTSGEMIPKDQAGIPVNKARADT